MNYQKRTIMTVCIAVVVAIVPAFLLVVCVDPFQIYHRPLIPGMGLQKNQRYQNAGLINSYLSDATQGYDSVIVGTSMSQNFTGEMVSKTLHWQKTLRLPMPGALADEQIAVLRHALDTGRVKHVLLEIHPFLYQDTYRQSKQESDLAVLYFPDFLYNDTLLDDAPYLFNVNVLKTSWKILLHNFPAEPITPETIGYWGDEKSMDSEHAEFNSSVNIEKLKAETSGFSLKAKNETEIDALRYPMFTNVLIPVLNESCNGNIEIVMFVPPWPRFRYQKSEKVTLRSVYMMRHILKGITHCSNISLYNFDLPDFAGDLNNYKDQQHYLPKINQELLDRIARQKNRLTLADVASFENQFIDTINHYTVYSSYAEAGKGK